MDEAELAVFLKQLKTAREKGWVDTEDMAELTPFFFYKGSAENGLKLAAVAYKVMCG